MSQYFEEGVLMMEWLIKNWELIALGILIADKIVAATPTKWDDLILTAIKNTLGSVKGIGNKGK